MCFTKRLAQKGAGTKGQVMSNTVGVGQSCCSERIATQATAEQETDAAAFAAGAWPGRPHGKTDNLRS